MANHPPPWFDESRLLHVEYAPGYSGWVVDLGDGTCRYANRPLLGADFGESRDASGRLLTEQECEAINRERPRWGDRVRLVDGRPDPRQIVERWVNPPSP